MSFSSGSQAKQEGLVGNPWLISLLNPKSCFWILTLSAEGPWPFPQINLSIFGPLDIGPVNSPGPGRTFYFWKIQELKYFLQKRRKNKRLVHHHRWRERHQTIPRRTLPTWFCFLLSALISGCWRKFYPGINSRILWTLSKCTFNVFFLLNDFRQWSHLNSCLSVCISSWDFIVDKNEKRFWQKEHWNFLSLVWTALWSWRWLEREKALSQFSQEYGLWALWTVFMCLFNEDLSLKVVLHPTTSHSSLFPVWILLCSFKLYCLENFLEHISHSKKGLESFLLSSWPKFSFPNIP